MSHFAVWELYTGSPDAMRKTDDCRFVVLPAVTTAPRRWGSAEFNSSTGVAELRLTLPFGNIGPAATKLFSTRCLASVFDPRNDGNVVLLRHA